MSGEQAEQRQHEEHDGQGQDPGVPPWHFPQSLPEAADHRPPVSAEMGLHQAIGRPQPATEFSHRDPAALADQGGHAPTGRFSGCRVPDSWLGHHITKMPKMHPHAEATYRVVSLTGGYFGVEVVIPETHPTTVSRFATEAEAEEWIARHKSRVQAEAGTQRWFRRSRPK